MKTKIKGILLDIDNTLYDYNQSHSFAKKRLIDYCSNRFNLPNTSKFQMGSWENMSKFKPDNVIIKNASMISKIPFFDKLEFSKLNNLE